LATELNEVELAVLIDAKRAELGGQAPEQRVGDELAVLLHHRPDVARHVVAVDIGALQLGQALTTVDVSADDAAREAAVVDRDRLVEETRRQVLRVAVVAVAFANAPAVVAPLADEVDLFE
jgi:hypothetical protein